jgi:hypothetical protein
MSSTEGPMLVVDDATRSVIGQVHPEGTDMKQIVLVPVRTAVHRGSDDGLQRVARPIAVQSAS